MNQKRSGGVDIKVPVKEEEGEANTKTGEEDVYRTNKRVQLAKLCGRELMFASTKPQPWDWEDRLKDETLHEMVGKMYLFVGKTETGKSYWIRDMLSHMRKLFGMVIVMSHTKFNGFYQQFIPNAVIINKFDPNVAKSIMRIQQARWGERGINANVLLILDDVASDNLQHQNIAQQIAMEGRHYGITTLFTTQHFTKAITQIRTNCRWLVVFTTTNERTIDHLYEEFATDFASKLDWEAFLDINTREHHSVIIDNNPYVRGHERYWGYKARTEEEIKPFSMCPARMWGDESKAVAVNKQRKVFKPAPKYKRSYLERLGYDAHVTTEEAQGKTDRYKRVTEFDFRRVVD